MQTVAFILCPGRSGSTILGYFLGAHPQVLHLGELVSPVLKKRNIRCRFCDQAACPIWGKVITEQLLKKVVGLFRDSRSAGPRTLGNLVSNFRGARYRGEIYRRVFASDDSLRVIVDGSKNVDWLRWNRRSSGKHFRIIHLTRDLRAVVNSAGRTRNETVATTTRNVIASYRRVQQFVDREPARNVLKVQYEEFVQEPVRIGRQMCEFLEIDFDERMLKYYEYPNHVIGGNPSPAFQSVQHSGRENRLLTEEMDRASGGFYHSKPPGLFLDERWKCEMDAFQLAEFYAIDSGLNESIGYPKWLPTEE